VVLECENVGVGVAGFFHGRASLSKLKALFVLSKTKRAAMGVERLASRNQHTRRCPPCRPIEDAWNKKKRYIKTVDAYFAS